MLTPLAFFGQYACGYLSLVTCICLRSVTRINHSLVGLLFVGLCLFGLGCACESASLAEYILASLVVRLFAASTSGIRLFADNPAWLSVAFRG